jgi:hypothetical protein
MKRITVKDKILLHIQHFKGYQQEYELPTELTQDGIAKGVGVSRSHAAITLSELKDKEYVNDQLGRVKGLHRQRKVYFITPSGEVYANGLRDIYSVRTVMIKDIEGNETEITFPDLTAYLYPFINKYITIFEVITHLGKNNVFDSKLFVEKTQAQEAVKSKKVAEEKVTEKSTQIPATTPAPPADPANAPPSLVQPQSGSIPASQQPIRYTPPNPNQYPSPTPYYNWYYYQQHQQNPYQYYQNYNYNPNFNYPQYPYYPFGFKLITHEERKKIILNEMKTFFGLGSAFCIFGLLSLLLSTGYCFPGYFVMTMLGYIFALIGFSIGFRRIAFTGTKGRRLILVMGIFFVGTLLVMLESMFFNFLMYLDISKVGPILLGMIVFLSIISLAKPIKTKYRTELAFAVGIFCMLFGIFSGLLLPENYLTNPFVFSPFWILFGITSLIVGNELIGKIQPKEKFAKIINYSIIGTGAFLFLTLLTRLISGEYESEMVQLNYASDLCWFGVGAYLISFRFVKKDYTSKMLDAIKISLPIGIGLLFILFGIFLGFLNKFIEGVIEIIIGAVVLRYGFTKKIMSKDRNEMLVKLSLPIFIIISESITFYLVLFG